MKITIDEINAKIRADVILADANTMYSRAALKKLFDMGNVLLDGQLARPGDKPKLGQVFEADLSPLQVEPDVIELPILFENDDVIVVNKPAGIISHSRGRYWQEASVASFVRDKTRDMTGDRAGIVHRLDRATSGVMIAAKNQNAQTYLQEQFSKKKVQKEYVALVSGTPEPAEAHIVAALARNPLKPQQFRVDKNGKQAETTYKVLQTHKGITHVSLLPITGRTHQLRVHMAYVGHPIVGDVLYAAPHKEQRMYLHAHKLHIQLPGGVEHHFEAPVPESFAERFKHG